MTDNTQYLSIAKTGVASQIPVADSSGELVLTTARYLTVVIHEGSASLVWTNQPASRTELFAAAEKRKLVDLSQCTQYRLVVNLIAKSAGANSVLAVEYSTDNGSTWLSMKSGTDVENTDNVDITTANGLITQSWATIVAGGRADVEIRIAGNSDVATGDPDFGGIEVQFR